MLLEQEKTLSLEPLFFDQKNRLTLREEVLKIVFRFPRLFDRLFYRCYELMVVNSPGDFLENRSVNHLKLILCIQFFLQKKMEEDLSSEDSCRKLFSLKLFRQASRICVGLIFSNSFVFQKERLMKALEGLLPGCSEFQKSFYTWRSSELPFSFFYFEIDKQRGDEISARQLRDIEKNLKVQMLASAPLTPALFWPYNKEESHRQIQLLIKEMQSKRDLPHLSIHFQEQTSSSLGFLVHLVRPRVDEPVELEKLPESLYFFRYSRHLLNNPFPIEVEAFSIRIDAALFDVCDTINLLYARRYLVKHLESIIGPFRDYNGGLFEKQQGFFEMIRLQLGSKIPYFDLFAEKVFYALHPFEKWFELSIDAVEDFFMVFSDLLQDERKSFLITTQSKLFTIVKTESRIDLSQLIEKNHAAKQLISSGQLAIGNFHYEFFSGQVTQEIEALVHSQVKAENTLQLIFQEGPPPTLNPHYSSGDMRSRLLNKLLFEGLTRLNEQGIPELAGAVRYECSDDGLIYTFYLRKARWSNGEKVTAFDYVESLQLELQDSVSHPEVLFSIKNALKFRDKKVGLNEVGIKALNPETILIELEKADPSFLEKLAQPFFFPLFGSHREPKWFNGPYLVQELKKNGLRLEKNPYFGKKRTRSFEYVEVEWIDNIQTIYERFKAGKVDWIGDPLTILSLEQIKELESENKLRKKAVPRRFSLHFNTKHPVLSSVAIRQALSLAIDRSLICREIFPHSIPLETSSYLRELAVFFFEEGLRELGLTRGSFPKLTFSHSDQTRRDQLAMYLQSAWHKSLGIHVELKMSNWNTFRSQVDKRNFEICGTIQDTLNINSVSYLERFEGDNPWNFSQWSNLVYRELVAAAKNEPNLAKQKELKNKAENLLVQNIPFTPLFDYVHLYALHPRLDCSCFDAEGCVDFSQGKTLLK